MKRNIEKRASEGKAIVRKHKRADLSLSELETLWEIYRKEGLYAVIGTAFDLGVSVGYRLK